MLSYKDYLDLQDYKSAEAIAWIVGILSALAIVCIWAFNCPVDTNAPDAIGTILF